MYALLGLAVAGLLIVWDAGRLWPLVPPDIVQARRLVREFAGEAGLHYELAKAYHRHGRYADATEEFLRTLKLKPTSASSAWGLYMSYRAAGYDAYAHVALEWWKELARRSGRGGAQRSTAGSGLSSPASQRNTSRSHP